MKICVVSAHNFAEPGGVRTNIIQSSDSLANLGHEITILAPRLQHLENEFNTGIDNLKEIGKTFILPGNGAHFDLSYSTAKQLKKIFRENDFDVIHFHNFLPMISIEAMKPTSNIPKVLTIHTHQKGLLEKVSKLALKQYLVKNFEHLIFVSESQKNFYDGLEEGKYSLIPNGIHIPKDYKPRSIANRKKIKLLFVGRYNIRKGLRYLIEALPEIIDNKNVHLTVVGPDNKQVFNEIKISDRYMDKITFRGPTSDEELTKVREKSDIYISPATGGESFGIVLLEAMMHGIPVIAFDNPGYSSVLKNELSWGITSKNNTKELAKKVIKLIDDKDKYEELSRRGINAAHHYSWDNLSKKLETIYKNVVNQ